ncbi:MAG: 2-C-methyl-D-erythritol 4-phosphate cytidylyltransferase [Prevotella sp.]|nr:2-C-methyl-D-erythritol 4-phosphate cytidylyltransferase [Prevotella sp.]
MRNIAIILAGGSGKRFGDKMPKQFLPLGGKSVIEHSVDAFMGVESIDEIAIVVHPDHLDRMKGIANRRKWGKLAHIIAGGSERYLSTLNAIEAYSGQVDETETNFILHDAARPWVSHEIIIRVVDALLHHEAVAVGVRSTDTVWQCSNQMEPVIQSIPPRNEMWQAQTPQAFRYKLLSDAYRSVVKDPSFHPTDDCGVVHSYAPALPIFVVEGELNNKKITYASDLES